MFMNNQHSFNSLPHAKLIIFLSKMSNKTAEGKFSVNILECTKVTLLMTTNNKAGQSTPNVFRKYCSPKKTLKL